MANRRFKNRDRISSRVARIERKIDRALSELRVLRQIVVSRTDDNEVVDRMHETARRLREQCERERDFIYTIFGKDS